VLQVSDALAAGANLNLVGLGAVSKVVLAAGGAAAGSTISNLASGGTVETRAGSVGFTVNVTNAAFNPADVLNLSIKSASSATTGTITAAGVETLNISTADAVAAGSAAVRHVISTLTAADATSIIVSGNNGLTIAAATGSAKVTSFDASGVVANGTADTADNLGVNFASLNTTATATVTITGGAGNDTLTGNVGRDIINGGAGADVINGGANADTITVGNGRDIVQITNNDDDTAGDIIGSGTSAADTITGFGLAASNITGADLSSNAKIQAFTAAGANLTVLNLDVTADDGGAGAGANQALAVEANATGAGQAAGVTFTMTNGILTLGGAGAAAVDTLGEWLTEAAAVAATAGDVLAFQFGADSYVFAQNGTADVLVQLVGVAGTSLVEVSGATTASAGAILFADM